MTIHFQNNMNYFGIIAGGGVAWRLWGPRSLLGYSIWSNSLITGKYPDASARRDVLMIPTYKNNVFTPVPSVSSPVETRSCSESARCCARCLISYGLCQSVFFTYGSWLNDSDTRHNSGWWSNLGTLRPAIATGLQHMKRFAYSG